MAILLGKPADAAERIHELEPHQVASELVAVLGRPIVAVTMGVKGTKIVSKWESRAKTPRDSRDWAMRLALQLVLTLSPRYSNGAIRSWFVGMNQYLDDHSPSEILCELVQEQDNDTARRLLNAARALANR